MRPGSLLAAMGRRERIALIAAFVVWLALTAWMILGQPDVLFPRWLVLSAFQLGVPSYLLIRIWQLRHTMAEARETARRARRA